uniref:RRM domain-containing protein n=1 Tax=Mesocestoides corti TaxID=53468 RepID=A0A5K3F7J6_MESCO
MLGQAIQQNVQSHGYPNSADLDFRGTDFGPAQMLRTSTVICSTSKLTNTRKNEKPRRHLKPFDERTIKSTKTVDGIAGIKVRKWQDDQTGKSLSNGFHRSGSINHSSISPVTDSDLVQNEDSGTAEMHSPTDVMMKRSHSWDLHTGSSPAECESISDNLEAIKSNDTETHPITSAAYMHETLTSPKRHHPASPSSLGPRSVILYAKEESATTSPIEDKMQGTNPSTTSVYCESSASMCREEVNREKPVIGCDMAVTKVLTDEPLPGYERVFPSPYQQSEDDAPGVSEKQKTNQLNGLNRSGSLLPRPGHGGTASLMSSRNKTVARSKRHSSRTNLYIRGLPKSMSENDLVSLVPDASAIRSVKLVVNNDGEGYGFIDFISNEAAVVAMQHIKLQNSSQYVNFAYESEKDPLNVYVTNIPESWNSDNVENLKQIFAPYGKITSALVMTRRSTNTCTGTGFVRYLTSEEAQRAIDGIRKAKITLPGAKRPLELKLADRQRTREHKR